MSTITLTASRGYQDIGTVGQTVAQLAGNVQSINQILDVGLRNTRDYHEQLRAREDLIGLGLATLINGNQLTSSGAGAGGTTLTASDSVVITANNITLVGDTATPSASYYYGTDSSSNLGYHALPSPGTGTVTSVGISSSNLTLGGPNPVTTSGTITIALSGTQVTNIGLGGTSIQPGAIQNMESAQWNSTSGAVQTALTVAQDILIPFACTLQEVDVLTQGPVGSCTVTILRGAASSGAISFPPATDITNGHNVTCAAASVQITTTTLTSQGWTTSFGQNDVLRLTLTANTSFTSVKIILEDVLI